MLNAHTTQVQNNLDEEFDEDDDFTTDGKQISSLYH